MMTPDVTLKEGDRLPILQRTIRVDGTAVDLDGYTVVFKVAELDGSATLVNGSATPDPDQDTNPGVVTYEFTAADALALEPGIYAAWFEAVASGVTLTAPNDGFLVVQVYSSGTDAGWSYTGDPANRDLDAVRLLINDVTSTDPQLRDAEIEWLLDQNVNVYRAAAAAATVLAGKYASLEGTSKKVGDLAISRQAGSQAASYRALAASLEKQAMRLTTAAPRAGGATDRDPIFSIGMLDFAGGLEADTGDE